MDDTLIRYSQLGDIFDFFSMGVMVLSPERKIVSLNHSAEIIIGCKESDLRGEYCHDQLIDSLCDGECTYLEAVENGRKSGSVDIEVTGQDNETRNITKIVSPVYGPDQKPLGCIEIFQDQSALKDLLERVRHDDRRLKIILDNLDIGLLTVDRGGHIAFFSNIPGLEGSPNTVLQDFPRTSPRLKPVMVSAVLLKKAICPPRSTVRRPISRLSRMIFKRRSSCRTRSRRSFLPIGPGKFRYSPGAFDPVRRRATRSW